MEPHGARQSFDLLDVLAFLLVGGLFGVLLGQVILRYFGVTFVWVEEFSIAMFTWLVFLGAALAFRHGEHVVIEIGYQALQRHLPAGAMAMVDLGLQVLIMTFLLVLSVGLWAMTRQTWELSSGLIPGFRVGFVYLGVLVCCVASLLVVGRRALALWGKRRLVDS